MLMRLARWMRMAGHDVSNPPEGADDSDLIEIALAEGRTLLTRDRLLAKRCGWAEASCILITSSDLDEQLSEIEEAGISLELEPERCTLCNGPLEEVEGSEGGPALWRCERCGKLYWRGSHWRGIRDRLKRRR